MDGDSLLSPIVAIKRERSMFYATIHFFFYHDDGNTSAIKLGITAHVGRSKVNGTKRDLSPPPLSS